MGEIGEQPQLQVHKSATINGHNISINDGRHSAYHVVVNGEIVFESQKFQECDALFRKLVNAVLVWRRT